MTKRMQTRRVQAYGAAVSHQIIEPLAVAASTGPLPMADQNLLYLVELSLLDDHLNDASFDATLTGERCWGLGGSSAGSILSAAENTVFYDSRDNSDQIFPWR